MDRIAAIFCFVALAAGQNGDNVQIEKTAAVPKITVTIDQSPVRVNANVTVMCKIEGMEPGAQRWWTKSVGERGRENTGFISTGGTIILPPYSNLERYTLKNAPEEGTNVQYHYLYINGVQKVDSGMYFCGVIADSSKFNWTSGNVQLDVYSDIDSVALNITGNSSDARHIRVREGDAVSITCISEGGIPTPSVNLAVDGQDRTAHFNVSMKWRYPCAGQSGCIHHADRIITAYNATYRPTYQDNNKDLVCTSSIPGESGIVPKTAQAKFEVTYSPKFECAVEQKARLHATNAIITCKVLGNPPVSNVHWKVAFGADPLQIDGEGATVEGLTSSRQMLSEEASEYVLTIDRVMERHFTTYELHATNDIRGDRHDITLQKDTTPVGGAQGPLTSLIATLLFATFAFILH